MQEADAGKGVVPPPPAGGGLAAQETETLARGSIVLPYYLIRDCDGSQGRGPTRKWLQSTDQVYTGCFKWWAPHVILSDFNIAFN